MVQVSHGGNKGGEQVVEDGRSTYIKKVYQTYYMDVYSYIMTLTKNASLSEELAQEVFSRHEEHISGKIQWADMDLRDCKILCADEFRKRKKEAVS